jgi:hypothetical protein
MDHPGRFGFTASGEHCDLELLTDIASLVLLALWHARYEN